MIISNKIIDILFISLYELYSMYNSFEAADSMQLKRSILEKLPWKGMTLRADLNDTGVYIMRNFFKNIPSSIQTIDFDLVKLMTNNQFKRKLLNLIRKDSPINDDTDFIDSLVNSETKDQEKAVIITYINDNPDELAINSSILNSQGNEEGMDSDENRGINLDSD